MRQGLVPNLGWKFLAFAFHIMKRDTMDRCRRLCKHDPSVCQWVGCNPAVDNHTCGHTPATLIRQQAAEGQAKAALLSSKPPPEGAICFIGSSTFTYWRWSPDIAAAAAAAPAPPRDPFLALCGHCGGCMRCCAAFSRRTCNAMVSTSPCSTQRLVVHVPGFYIPLPCLCLSNI